MLCLDGDTKSRREPSSAGAKVVAARLCFPCGIKGGPRSLTAIGVRWDNPRGASPLTSGVQLRTNRRLLSSPVWGNHGRSSGGDPVRERVRLPTLFQALVDLPLLLSRTYVVLGGLQRAGSPGEETPVQPRSPAGSGAGGPRGASTCPSSATGEAWRRLKKNRDGSVFPRTPIRWQAGLGKRA